MEPDLVLLSVFVRGANNGAASGGCDVYLCCQTSMLPRGP